MTNKAVYENDNIRCVMGDAIRPGGFFLTERAISVCGLGKDDKVLDIGCGMGATVNFLKENMKIEAFGIDPSDKLINLGKEKYGISLTKGKGESLPYKDGTFDAVFTECTLSLMKSYETTIKEVYRVLKPKGFFVVSDVYGRNPEYIDELKKTEVKSCLRNLFDLSILLTEIDNRGFEILVLEDWTFLLNKLMVEIIFKYGSMAEFWRVTTCGNCKGFKEKLSACRPGYFLLIGIKEG